jgi:hypothetical protein
MKTESEYKPFEHPRGPQVSVTLIALLAALFLAGNAKASLSGAIFTTDSTCTQVNGNIYQYMGDVYLDGGPAKVGAASLPPGSYYVQVTTPNGALLGSSVTAPIPMPFVVAADGSVTCFQLWGAVLKTSDSTTGYDPTTNPGNEYKVWVSSNPLFPNGSTKTDNFKVRHACLDAASCSSGPPMAAISGIKFNDLNGNGTQDPGELGLGNWVITFTGTLPGGSTFTDSTTTDDQGNWSKVYPQGTSLTICETMQTGWKQTAPLDSAQNGLCAGGTGGATASSGCWSGTIGINDECNLNFGNQALPPTVSKTASGAYTDTYTWTIKKCVDKTLVKQAGGNVTFNYTVKVSNDGGTITGVKVTGTITVNNNSIFDITGTVTDSLSDGTVATVGVTPSFGNNFSVAAGGSATINYEADLASLPASSIDNTATFTWADQKASDGTVEIQAGSASYKFPAVSFTATLVDDCVCVTDTFAGTKSTLGKVCNTDNNPTTFTYSHTVPAPANGCVSYCNTAVYATDTTGNTGSASAKVTVCGPELTGALSMGFWQNKNGQGIICAAAEPALANWLKAYKPFADLTATTGSGVATYVYNIIKAASAAGTTMNPMLKAQMLATALDVYFSDPALGGNKINAPHPIGGDVIDLTTICNMIDGSGGTSTCGASYENVSSAFNGATSLTVSQMLTYAASQCTVAGGLSGWYGQVKATQQLAKDGFDAINNGVAFAP